jgi:hypothetical protein
VGLLEEAAEVEIGPPTHCLNCGRDTPSHAFCVHCGIALRALPKTARRESQPPLARQALVPASFALAVATAVGLAAGVVSLTKAGPVQPPCIAGRPCGQPPHGPPVRGRPVPHARASAVPFARGHKWTSGVGASIRYDPRSWSAVEDTAEALELHMTDPTLLVRIVAVPAVSAKPFNLLNAQLASAEDRYLGLVEDDEAEHELLEPLVGYVHGTGGMYRATANLPPSPGARVELAFEAATSGSATVLVRATTYERAQSAKEGFSSPFPVLETVDELLQTFEWGAARP